MDGPKILEEEVNYVAGRIENKMAVGSNKIIIEDIKIQRDLDRQSDQF